MAKLRNFRGRVGVPFTSDVILRVRPTDYDVQLHSMAYCPRSLLLLMSVLSRRPLTIILQVGISSPFDQIP